MQIPWQFHPNYTELINYIEEIDGDNSGSFFRVMKPFHIYKKVFKDTWNQVVIRLLAVPDSVVFIPHKDINLVYSRRNYYNNHLKLRFSQAYMLQRDHNNHKQDFYQSVYDPLFNYEAGEMLFPSKRYWTRTNVCARGIHAFFTLKEAETYGFL